MADLLVSGLAQQFVNTINASDLPLAEVEELKKKVLIKSRYHFCGSSNCDVTHSSPGLPINITSLSSYELMLVISGFLSSAGLFFYSIFLNISVFSKDSWFHIK